MNLSHRISICIVLSVLVAVSSSSSLCANVYGQELLEDTGALEAYLDIADEPLNTGKYNIIILVYVFIIL